MSKFSTSLQLMNESWRVLMADKELLWFPTLSGLLLIIVSASFIVPFAVFTGLTDAVEESGSSLLLYVGVFVFYVVTYSIGNFFNAALVGAASIRLRGGNPTLTDGLTQAWQHVGKIILWSIVSATVGVVLRAIAERSGTIGKIVTAMVGITWSLVTYFAVPIIIFENLSLGAGIKRSGELFKRTWGENVISQVSFSFMFIALGLLGFFIPVVLAATGIEQLLIPSIILMTLYWIFLGIISSTLVAILDTALYLYATTGTVPATFSADLVRHAFVPKKI